MLRVLGCITLDHDLRLVVLAGLICLFASLTAIELLSRARSAQGGRQWLWIVGTGTVAGCGVWTTHFVAMLAYRSSLAISYDIALTALSIVAAVTLATLAIVLTVRTRSGLIGGAVMGVAIGTMHYIGMAALRGPVEATWELGYVAASLVIGPALSAVAFAVAMRGQSLKVTAAAAGLLTVAIVALHFTGMAGVTLTPVAVAAETFGAFEPMSLGIAVAAIAMLIIGLGFTGTIVDRHLTERAQDEAARLRAYVTELEATKRNLEETSANLMSALAAAAQSSQSKSQFLAAMSHELRTPLNAIIGYSELMRMEPYGPLGDKRYLEYLGDIQGSGTHLLSLINDVLDLARLDANRLDLDDEVVDVGQLVDEAMRVVGHQAREAELTLERRLPSGLPEARVDRRRIKQVLLNLLSNAVKFTPPGGRVEVVITLQADGLAIAVTDTGIGMRAEDIPVALERFGQIDSSLARKYEGTGLGLPLSKQLIELHGGRLTIDSVEGKGTTVTMLLSNERLLPQAIAWSAAAAY